MNNFIKILKNEPYKAYDYICNNYPYMSSNALSCIIKELLFAVYRYSKNEDSLAEDVILADVLENLTDLYGEE